MTKFKDIVPLKPATADGFMHTKGEVYYSSSKRKTGYISCDESAGEDPKCASGQSI